MAEPRRSAKLCDKGPMYCIYTDRDVPDESGNWDHVVPLSLGGKNGFVVWSDRDVNSTLGTQVDGKLGQDPLLVFALRNSGVTGHAGKPAIPVWKRVDLKGRPTQVTWGADKVTAWDARERRELSESEFAGETMTAELRVDVHLTNRFLAKVALGAGQFIYGDVFRTTLDCGPLRELAFSDAATARQSQTLKAAKIAICDRFHADSTAGGPAYLYRVLMECTNRSLVIAVPHHDAIAFHVGLVGVYIGSIICDAETEALPRDGEHDLGHVLGLAPGDFERCSYRALCQEFYREVLGKEPPGR